MRLVITICILTVQTLSYAGSITTSDLKKLAEKELSYKTENSEESQTVKIKANIETVNSPRPSSNWALGFHHMQIEPIVFSVKSVSLKTPEITSSQMLYIAASTPIYKLLNDQYISLFSRFSYGKSKTEFQSVSNMQNGTIEVFRPTIGLSYNFLSLTHFSFNFDIGYTVSLYNVKAESSSFQQSSNAQSLQNSISAYWKSFKTSGFELSLSKDSLLSGDFEPTYSFKAGYRGDF